MKPSFLIAAFFVCFAVSPSYGGEVPGLHGKSPSPDYVSPLNISAECGRLGFTDAGRCIRAAVRGGLNGDADSARFLGAFNVAYGMLLARPSCYSGLYGAIAASMGPFRCARNGAGTRYVRNGLEWYALAAIKYGDPEAAVILGDFYSSEDFLPGFGFPDYSGALEWYAVAGERKYAPALYSIGVMYFNGRGVGRDYGKAIEYFVAASLQGDADAFYAVGVMYYEGIGVEQNVDLALEQLGRAAELGSREAPAKIREIRREFRDMNKMSPGADKDGSEKLS